MALNTIDHQYSEAALRLGLHHQGFTGPNPAVGTIIAHYDEKQKKYKPISRGITAHGGRPHSEVIALSALKKNQAKGATTFVSLEPCAHYGKTPPCTKALIETGIARCITNITDPNPKVANKGHEQLKKAGVKVTKARITQEACIAHAPFFWNIEHQSTYVTLKIAHSKDGAIALKKAEKTPLKLSNKISHDVSHMLRARHDAIMIGVKTLILDDPDLTCRLHGLEHHSPKRIIIDPQGRTPVNAKMLCDGKGSVLFVTTLEGKKILQNKKILAQHEAMTASTLKKNIKEFDLKTLCKKLYQKGYTSLMVEGGAQLAQSFLNQNQINCAYLFECPLLLGNKGLKIFNDKTHIQAITNNPHFIKTHERFYKDDHLKIYHHRDHLNMLKNN